MLKRQTEIDLTVPVDEQPTVAPLREASAAAQRRFDAVRGEWAAARSVLNPDRSGHITATEVLRARAAEREVLPKVEAAEVEAIEARDQFERVRKEMAAKLRELREPERLRLIDDVAQALHHAAAVLHEYGAWCEETSRVTGLRGDSRMFARGLTPESVEAWLGYQRGAK